MSKSTGQKFGRAKRRPSHAGQAARTARNKERRIKKAEAVRQFYRANPTQHGVARAKRRAMKLAA